jgi:hydroxyethylthiazole kinase-like uncharacterized protein yjeF
MAEADRQAVAGRATGFDLMEQAGRAVADRVAQTYPSETHVVVVAGPGNNGGDGYVAARLLAERGCHVRVLRVGKGKLSGDAAHAARRWIGLPEQASPRGLSHASLVIDALFGAGLNRPVEGAAAAMIEAINSAGIPVLAVDLPSGINGSTGAVMGAAVKATETVTFFRRKPGHLLLPGRLHCGPVHVADIGIPDTVLRTINPRLFVNRPALWGRQFPVPRAHGHKYSRGHAIALSGGLSHTGAARLAARGALRAGAGLVTLASPSEALAVNAAASLAVMVRAIDSAAELSKFLSDPRVNTVILGPGGGVGVKLRKMVLAAIAAEGNVLLDADALTSFADDPRTLRKAIMAGPATRVVVTPHEGEFNRLFSMVPELAKVHSKYEKARLAASWLGATVLYKGPDTVVAEPDGRAAIAENAPAWLATAGSGDVLAGMIAGLLAQGMPPFEASCAGTWLHGEAAAEVGPGLISEDLPEAIPAVYRRLLPAIAGA